MNEVQWEIAATAARLIAEEGMAWGPAKHKAVRELNLPQRTALPPSEVVEDALREHLALFQADTQPGELRQLRELALRWMERLAAFQPLLTGAVWRGTANRWSTVHLQLYSDDDKAPEIALLNLGEAPEPGAPQRDSRGRDVQTLQLWLRPPPGFDGPVGLHLSVHASIELRGALLPDARGHSLRGDAAGLRRLLDTPMKRRHLLLAALPATLPAAHAEAPLWAARFKTPAGGELALADFKGRWLLLNFWATWCAPCVKEMPELDRFHAEFGAQGWPVVGLAIDGPTPVRDFLAKRPVRFPIGLAGLNGSELAKTLGNLRGGLPFTVLANPAGEIAWRHPGETSFAQLKAMRAKLLAG